MNFREGDHKEALRWGKTLQSGGLSLDGEGKDPRRDSGKAESISISGRRMSTSP